MPDTSAADTRFPSIEGLRAFEAAARLGSLERAAEALHIGASAVSKRISTLEELLGAALLDRTLKPLALTATGKEYLEQVRAALALLAATPLHRRSAQRLQRLRITAPPTFARQILVPALPAFTEAHPELELELLLSTPYLDEAGPAADLEIRNGEIDAIGEQGQVLMQDWVTPMAAPALLQRLPALRRPADLAQAPLLRTPLEPWAPWFAAAGLDWGEPAQGMKLVDLGLTLEAAVSGQGVALARPSLARHWLASGALRPMFGIGAAPAWRYYLLPHAAQGPAADFATWLRGECEDAAHAAAALVSGSA